MKKIEVSKAMKAVMAIFLVLLALSAIMVSNHISDLRADEAKKIKLLEAEKAKQISELNKALEEQKDLTNAVVDDLISEVDKLKAELESKPVVQPPVIVVEASDEQSYLLDEVLLGSATSELTLSDSKLEKLSDSTVSFDGDEYQFEEFVKTQNLLVASDDEDYKGLARLEIPELGLEYFVKFDSELDPSLIGEDDEKLYFSFLGEVVEVSSWDGDELVLSKGAEVVLKEGQSTLVSGKQLLITFIGDNDEVMISYDGIDKTMSEGQTRNFNGVDVYVKEVLSNRRDGIVTLRTGVDVKETVKDGDEYSDDSPFSWVIDASQRKIGVVLTESLVGFDEDETYNALAVGESFSLPKDFVKITFKGLDEVQYFDVEADFASKNSVEYFRLKGDFEKGLESYEKLYISKTTSDLFGVNEDNDLELISDSRIVIGDSDYELLVTPITVKVVLKGDTVALAEFNKDFSSASLDGVELNGDENHLSLVGIKVSNIEDSEEDEKFSFSIPEERVFANIVFE
jgi:hypothetical protein